MFNSWWSRIAIHFIHHKEKREQVRNGITHLQLIRLCSAITVEKRVVSFDGKRRKFKTHSRVHAYIYTLKFFQTQALLPNDLQITIWTLRLWINTLAPTPFLRHSSPYFTLKLKLEKRYGATFNSNSKIKFNMNHRLLNKN